jgi:hypothetical protein
MKSAYVVTLTAAALAQLQPAQAKTDWAKSGLDPAKAYVLVQIEPVEFQMMGNNRIVSGFFLAPYDASKKAISLTEIPKKQPQVARVVLKKEAIAKEGKRRQYFAAITPGTWVFEGAGGDVPLMGAPLTSFSLGSYSFVAKAGEVIDLGVVTLSRETSDNPDTKMTAGKMAGMIFAGPFGGGRVEPVPMTLTMRARGQGDFPLPAWVPENRLTRPGFAYGATFSNILGGLINRIDGKAGRNRQTGEIGFPSGPQMPAPASN